MFTTHTNLNDSSTTKLNNSFLNATGVGHAYSGKQALSGVNLIIEKQGVTALLGQNGAGKSTFIHACLGLLAPDIGDIHLLGCRTASQQAKNQLGVMLQEADLADQLTIREQLTLFASYYPNPASVDAVLKQCDLNSFADQRYGRLSGGQKRRAQFALSIIGRPKLLFLDEPTTGLDVNARMTMWQTIRELEKAGTAIILTTHYLEEAEALADRVVVLDHGEIIADAPTSEFSNSLSSSTIHCVSQLTIPQIASIEHVQAVTQQGRLLQIICHDSASTLRELLNADGTLSDISVSKSSLEDAFKKLTSSSENHHDK